MQSQYGSKLDIQTGSGIFSINKEIWLIARYEIAFGILPEDQEIVETINLAKAVKNDNAVIV